MINLLNPGLKVANVCLYLQTWSILYHFCLWILGMLANFIQLQGRFYIYATLAFNFRIDVVH